MPKPTLATIPTPALILDNAAVDRNLRRLADYAKKHGVGIRPHTKTHKSLVMAGRQAALGAVGMTAAKVGEAEIMAKAHNDVLLAYPALDPARTARAAELAKRVTLRVAVDSATAVDALAAAARTAGSTIGILVDLDVGLHRTGLQTPEQALALAQYVSKTQGVRLDGLFFYPGHLVAKPDEQIRGLAGVQQVVATTLDLFKRSGLAAPVVSGGSTPTAYLSHLVPAQTEIRPGTYPYNDRTMLDGGWSTIEDCAARIICTVVSEAVPGKVVLDAGSKTFTSDRLFGDHNAGYGLIVEYPKAKITRCTEEHGEVDLSASDKRPRLGERVSVIPNHICPCVNLQNTAWLLQSDGTLEPLTIDARGKLS